MSYDFILAEIAMNNKAEQDAIENYFRLIDKCRALGMPTDLIAQLEEIISDEMNHSEKLTDWEIKLSNIKPATE